MFSQGIDKMAASNDSISELGSIGEMVDDRKIETLFSNIHLTLRFLLRLTVMTISVQSEPGVMAMADRIEMEQV